MNIADAGTVVRLDLVGSAGNVSAGLQREIHRGPGFPMGVWGPPQPDDDRKVPAGDVINAVDGVLLRAVANIPAGLPPIDFRRVESGPRHPLPFVHEAGARPGFVAQAQNLDALLPPDPTDAQVFAIGSTWMAREGHGRTALAALHNERSAPPRFGSLADGLTDATPPAPAVTLPARAPDTAVDVRVLPPVAIAVLNSPLIEMERPIARTTVTDVGQSIGVRPPTLEQVATRVDTAIPARLQVIAGAAGALSGGTRAPSSTIIAAGAVPLTRSARGGVAAVGGRGAVADGRERLAAMSASLAGARAPGAAASLAAGEVAVLRLPNAVRDLDVKTPRPRLTTEGGLVRFVALGHGGHVLADDRLGDVTNRAAGTIPAGTERIALMPAGDAPDSRAGLLGWHTASALPYIGWSTALASGATVRAEGASIRSGRLRRTAGWVQGAELVAGTSIVITEFRATVTVVIVALDDPIGTGASRGLSLGLSGATRPEDAAGQPRAPRGVVLGNRTFLLYEIVPERTGVITVTVASEDGWQLAGVLGSTAPVDAVAGLLTGRGLDAVVQPVTGGASGARTFKWATGKVTEPPGGGPVRPRRAARPAKPAGRVKQQKRATAKTRTKKPAARKTSKPAVTRKKR
jgi:hypothetical protein